MAVESRLHGSGGAEGVQTPGTPAPAAQVPLAPEAGADVGTPAPTAPAGEATPAPATPGGSTPAAEPPQPDPSQPLEPAPGAPTEPAAPVTPAEPAAPAEPSPPVEPAAATPAQDDFDARMQSLAMRELALVRAERAQKQDNEAIKTKLEAYDQIVKLSKEDPLKAMESAGIDYQAVTNQVLNDGQLAASDVTKQVQESVESFQKNLEEVKTDIATQKQAQDYSNYVSELKNLVDTSGKFPLISYYNAIDNVVQEVNRHYEATDQILDNEAALTQYEAKLQKEVDGLMQLDHIRKGQEHQPGQTPPAEPAPEAGPATGTQENANAVPGAPPEQAPPATPPPATVQSTLRNSQQGTAGPQTPSRFISDEESLVAAAKLITFDG